MGAVHLQAPGRAEFGQPTHDREFRRQIAAVVRKNMPASMRGITYEAHARRETTAFTICVSGAGIAPFCAWTPQVAELWRPCRWPRCTRQTSDHRTYFGSGTSPPVVSPLPSSSMKI